MTANADGATDMIRARPSPDAKAIPALHPLATVDRIRKCNSPTLAEEVIMKFMLTFTWAPDARIREEAVERFQKTGGLPPAGVTLLGRWTRADLSGGYDLLEAEDLRKVTEFAYMWSDLMKLDITPVVEDDDLNAVFQAVAR
jgi:hypothetical protein